MTGPVPGAAAMPNSYAVAVVDQTQDEGLARTWLDLLLSDQGREILDEAGFGPAP